MDPTMRRRILELSSDGLYLGKAEMALVFRLVSIVQSSATPFSPHVSATEILMNRTGEVLPLPKFQFQASEADEDYYKKLWRRANTEKLPYLNEADAIAFLSKSGLESDEIEYIWELSVGANRGNRLVYDAFVVAIRLVSFAQLGFKVLEDSDARSRIVNNIMVFYNDLTFPLPRFDSRVPNGQSSTAKSLQQSQSNTPVTTQPIFSFSNNYPSGKVSAPSTPEMKHYNRPPQPSTALFSPYANFDRWVPTVDEIIGYDKLFALADVAKIGRVEGLQAVTFLAQSNLPKATLREIWRLAAGANESFLSRREFYIAMRMIAMSQAGITVTEKSFLEKAGVILNLASLTVDPPQTLNGPTLQRDAAEVPVFDNAELFANSSDDFPPSVEAPVSSQTLENKGPVLPLLHEGFTLQLGGKVDAGRSAEVLMPAHSGDSDPRMLQSVPPLTESISDKDQNGDEPPMAILTTWKPTVGEQKYFDRLFDTIDIFNVGYLSGMDGVSFFKTSQLPKAVLREIWNLCAEESTSKLTRREFYYAMRFISMSQAALVVSKRSFSISETIQIPLPQFIGVDESSLLRSIEAEELVQRLGASSIDRASDVDEEDEITSPDDISSGGGGKGAEVEDCNNACGPANDEVQAAIKDSGSVGTMIGASNEEKGTGNSPLSFSIFDKSLDTVKLLHTATSFKGLVHHVRGNSNPFLNSPAGDDHEFTGDLPSLLDHLAGNERYSAALNLHAHIHGQRTLSDSEISNYRKLKNVRVSSGWISTMKSSFPDREDPILVGFIELVNSTSETRSSSKHTVASMHAALHRQNVISWIYRVTSSMHPSGRHRHYPTNWKRVIDFINLSLLKSMMWIQKVKESSDTVKAAVYRTDKFQGFVTGLVEMNLIICRIVSISHLICDGKDVPPIEKSYAEFRLRWAKLLDMTHLSRKFNHEETLERIKERSTFISGEDCNTVMCNVCCNLLSQDDKKATYLGSEYHLSCANLWVNHITRAAPTAAEGADDLFSTASAY